MTEPNRPITTSTLAAITRAMADDFNAQLRSSNNALFWMLRDPSGWPRRFHPFPALDKAQRRLSVYRYRAGLIVDVARGYHDSGI